MLDSYKVNTKECIDYSSAKDEDYVGGILKKVYTKLQYKIEKILFP